MILIQMVNIHLTKNRFTQANNAYRELKKLNLSSDMFKDQIKMLDDESGETSTEDEIGSQEGVELEIALPNKRVKGLEMLSGGERALTSIALIFAMSQVNPPLFIILDETDAALEKV